MSSLDSEIQIVYRCGNQIFESKKDAEAYLASKETDKITFQQTLTNISDEIQHLTAELEGPQGKECRCNMGQSCSESCPVHLCTCDTIGKRYPQKEYDHYVCKHHTNTYFRNKGCFWCANTDCSKNGC
jgi:hypothetical protein